MNKIDEQLNKIKQQNRLGLMTHVVVGYPSLEETVELVKVMYTSGVDFVELQIPFSDPLADGPTIMKACEDSLKNGTKVKDAFEIASKLSSEIQIPLIFMAYFNNVFQYGIKKFCEDAQKAGISGLIIPDFPLEEEENEHLGEYTKKNGMHLIRVLSPASTDERLQKNSKIASGFIYFTARQGITGAKSELDPKLIQNLKNVKKFINLPLAVGFGISKKAHVDSLKGSAEMNKFFAAQIAVVGSAILDIINKSEGKDYLGKVKDFLKLLKS